MKRVSILITLVLFATALLALVADAGPAGRGYPSKGNFINHTARPLRYWPEGSDFVITNGSEYFNRPLYCLNSGFRIDAGDQPELSLYLPGRGGNLRLGIKTAAGVKWLDDAQTVIARYQPGSMFYQIRAPLFGDGDLDLTVLPLSQMKGVIVRAELHGGDLPVELIYAFGGANGMKGRRGGDIGCEREPVSQFFQLHPEECRGNEFLLLTNGFVLRSKPATIAGIFPPGSKLQIADANKWNSASDLLASAGATGFEFPVVVGQTDLPRDKSIYLALQQIGPTQDSPTISAGDLPELFSAAESQREKIADRVAVKTPDPFINAAVPALCIAADGIWDERQQCFMHGAVAWRVRLLGWRGPYAGDELGWHNRTAEHFAGFARQQNTNPIPDRIPPADEDSNLARNETALHSNGDLTKSHYDMNLVAVDVFFRHLLWTGDLNYARHWWPVIERHLAWERRLFRREFGPDQLPLYEAYADIWASDNMEYEGGGVAYASAYNYFENKMAARVAGLLGKNASPYEQQAELIHQAMQKYLWLPDDGWLAEYKDYLGLQLVHPSPGLWTFYHTIDSQVPTPFQAWEMSRFVDTQIAHIPIQISGGSRGDEALTSLRGFRAARSEGNQRLLTSSPTGYYTLPDSNWMPYEWSVNNVVMAEVANTSLAYWEANRPEAAFNAFKGCLLNSMFMGKCPGNLGMTTTFDIARGEAQRDFGDAIGTTSRALVEGLFGIHPDVLAGELTIHPGFPPAWNEASIRHPDFDFSFGRHDLTETYSILSKFPKPMTLRLQVPALRDRIASVTVNGQPARWHALESSVGVPQAEIQTTAARQWHIVVVWAGDQPVRRGPEKIVKRNRPFTTRFAGAKLINLADSENALSDLVMHPHSFHAAATGVPGHRTVFAQLQQGEITWWQPVSFAIQADPESRTPASIDWRRKLPADTPLETVNLAPYFNDKVTQIFRNGYRSPRSPFCSLAIPQQGIGGWADDKEQFKVDDSGLRAVAAKHDGKLLLPNGVPFATPTNTDARNIVFVSQWENYPDKTSIPLSGKAFRVYLLMAGSSNPMQSRFDNGEVIVTYSDGTTTRLALRNPTNWWPIDQDYFIDDYAFRLVARAARPIVGRPKVTGETPVPLPPRVDLKTGKVRILNMNDFKGKGGVVPGGAATVLELPLNPNKELKSLTIRAVANEVVIGLMAATLER